MAFLGVDVGGSFLKGTILEPGSNDLLNVERRVGPELDTFEPLARTLNPKKLVSSVTSLIEDLSKQTKSVEGILLSGQMHGVVLCDLNGDAHGPIITWQDNRDTQLSGESSSLDQLRTRLSPNDQLATGNELRSGLPVSTLFRLLNEGLSLKGKVPASLLSYCASQLVSPNPKQLTMHTTDAAAHGMLDLATEHWHTPTLEAAGLGELSLPLVSSDLIVIGQSKSIGCPVYTAVGDHQASLLGVGLEYGELSINIATGSQVSILASSPTGVTGQTRPYFHESLLRTITHLPAGRSLNALLALLTQLGGPKGDELWSIMASEVANTPTTTAEADIQFFFWTPRVIRCLEPSNRGNPDRRSLNALGHRCNGLQLRRCYFGYYHRPPG
jgi:xylulokinase